jgi:hypothetical protein
MTRDRFLILFLRIVGAVAGSAALCAVMPLRTMDEFHRIIGMGPLPSGPIVEYLARSTSAFYAFLGALLWMVSLDLPRYRPLVRSLGLAFVALGALLFWTDITAGLPWFWKAAEGPIDTFFGIVLIWVGRTEKSS